MKRLLALIAALLMLAVPALAWEVSNAMVDFAAQVAPGYTLLDGFLFDNTAMLLLKDAQGEVYFAGCVRDGDAWTVTLSTPLPEGSFAIISYASSDVAVLNLDHPSLFLQRNLHDNTDCNFTILLQEGKWLIQYTDYLTFAENCVWSEDGYCCYGERLFSLGIADVDWLTFPLTVQEATTQMDTADWALLAQEAALHPEPGIQSFARYNPGTPLLILSRREGWYEVAVLGGRVTGWVEIDHLLVGDMQAQVPHLMLDDLPMLELGRQSNQLPCFLLPDGPTLSSPGDLMGNIVRIMGTWEDGWLHIYDRNLPGGEGFLQERELLPMAETGFG